MTVRKRILFVGEAVSLAHIGRPLTLAASLDPARYDIHFAWDARYAGLAEVPGTSFHPLRTIASSQFLDALDAGAQSYTAADFAAYIEAERALYAEVKPDLIVADFRLTVATSGEQVGIPQVTVVNAYWSPYAIHNSYEPLGEPARLKARRQLGALKRSLLGGQPPSNDPETVALNEARQGMGLKPLKDWYEIACTGTYTLYAEPPDLFPMRRLPASHRFIGPVLWAPDLPEAPWWNSWDPSRPIIYVTLGSTGASSPTCRSVCWFPPPAGSSCRMLRRTSSWPTICPASNVPGSRRWRCATAVAARRIRPSRMRPPWLDCGRIPTSNSP